MLFVWMVQLHSSELILRRAMLYNPVFMGLSSCQWIQEKPLQKLRATAIMPCVISGVRN